MRKRHDTLDRKCRRNLAGELSWHCERAGELRSDTSRSGAHRLLPWPKSVLSWIVGSCRCQSARAIRRRVAMGTVKWFNPTNGYGFIQSDCGGQPDSGGKVWVANSGRRQARQRDRRALLTSKSQPLHLLLFFCLGHWFCHTLLG